MIDKENNFNQPAKNDARTYDEIQKITTEKGDQYIMAAYQIIPILQNIKR